MLSGDGVFLEEGIGKGKKNVKRRRILQKRTFFPCAVYASDAFFDALEPVTCQVTNRDIDPSCLMIHEHQADHSEKCLIISQVTKIWGYSSVFLPTKPGLGEVSVQLVMSSTLHSVNQACHISLKTVSLNFFSLTPWIATL